MADFKTILISKRKELGLSQSEMAEYLHVTRQAISKWENGKGMPDTSYLPQISELLGVSVDELLTGKEPEKQVVEKVVVKEKEVVKPMPVRKILAIVVPIVLVVVLASALMGVYIPKAIENNTPPIIQEPEPEIKYTEVYIKGKSNTDDSCFQAPLIKNKAYYGLRLQFSSEYTFYITAPKGATATFIETSSEAEDKIIGNTVIAEFDTAKTVEYTHYINTGYYVKDDRVDKIRYDLAGFNTWNDIYYYSLIIDMTNCSEEDRIAESQKIVVRHHTGFENVTVPANGTYFVALPIIKETGAKHYVIKSDGVQFVDTRILAHIHNYSPWTSMDQYYGYGLNLPLNNFFVLNYENCDAGGENCDRYIGFINETEMDIKLEIEEVPIEEINLFQTVNVKSCLQDEYYTVYKLNIVGEPRLMFKFIFEEYKEHWTTRMLYYYGDNRSLFADWNFADGYEPEWNSCVFVGSYISSGTYYIIAFSDPEYDFTFALDSWNRYNTKRP